MQCHFIKVKRNEGESSHRTVTMTPACPQTTGRATLNLIHRGFRGRDTLALETSELERATSLTPKERYQSLSTDGLIPCSHDNVEMARCSARVVHRQSRPTNEA
uniref:Uncharacterized protein n=1 Tax=Coccidioides posadasii RMSCC 3488 TaxID=454284 RepID=A0A0J6F351_COCPO|nr:hypothetical protein CPAG_00030 [Coccidioides posadasii RMSCC 3488]